MNGTDRKPPYVAPHWSVRSAATVQVLDLRTSAPAPCREFEASWENGEHNADCDTARARIRLCRRCNRRLGSKSLIEQSA
jgi:hypothetical protein